MTSRSSDVKTPMSIISFAPQIFEAKEDKWGNKYYTPSLLFPKTTNLAVLHEAALEAAEKEWGEKAKQWIKDGIIKSPFLDGDGKQGKTKDGEPKKGHAGCWFIRCKSGVDYKPKVFDAKRNQVFTVESCPSGSHGYGVVNAFTWENDEQGKGITFGISLFQVAKIAMGDEILGGGGGPDPDKWLETIDDAGDAPAATKTGAGAAGLFG